MRFVIVLLVSILIAGGGAMAIAQSPAPSYNGLSQADDISWRGWSQSVNVSQCPTNQATFPTLGVAAGGQTLYLAWTDGRGTPKDIYYATSTNNDRNWQDPQAVAVTATDSWRPSMVISGTTPVLSWAAATTALDRETLQLTLGDDAPATVPNHNTVLAYAPRLAWGLGGELHLALQGGQATQPDILYSRLNAGAADWPTATIVFTHTASGSYNPAIAVSADGQVVHLVWQENSGTHKSEIRYLHGQRSGEEISWSPSITLSEDIARSVRPAIALWGETLYVVWGEQESGYEEQYVRYSRSDDGGANWNTPARVDSQAVSLNNVAPTDIAPALALTPLGNPCVAWHGFRPDATIEAEEIYLTCSTDQGANWGTAVNVSRSPDVISIRPVLAIGSDGLLNMAWQELAGSNPLSEYQIYYARSLPYSVLLPIVRR